MHNRFIRPRWMRLMLKLPLSAGALFPWQSGVTKCTVNHDARCLTTKWQTAEFETNCVSPEPPNCTSSSFVQSWDFYRCITPTRQAELATCHRTAELLRGEHHIRRSESSSLPAVIHTVNLIIHQPLSPPTSPPAQAHVHFYPSVENTTVTHGLKR